MNQQPGEQLCAELVVYAARLVRAVSRRTSHDVPATTLRLLSQVDELGPATIGQLARADRCSQPTMSAAVHQLVSKGWVDKEPNPEDARSSLVTLTEAGRVVLAEARQRNAAVIAERFAHDTQHDVEDLATAVAVIRSLLDTTVPEEGTS